MEVEWDGGLIVYTGWAPFGHQAFALPLLGLPGVMLMHDYALDLPDRQLTCLKAHERFHWVQWARWTAPALVIVGLLVAFGPLPWWTLLGCPYVWHAAYLLGRRKRWEAEADRVQADCIDGVG